MITFDQSNLVEEDVGHFVYNFYVESVYMRISVTLWTIDGRTLVMSEHRRELTKKEKPENNLFNESLGFKNPSSVFSDIVRLSYDIFMHIAKKEGAYAAAICYTDHNRMKWGDSLIDSLSEEVVKIEDLISHKPDGSFLGISLWVNEFFKMQFERDKTFDISIGDGTGLVRKNRQ